jgi:hypothetical protein
MNENRDNSNFRVSPNVITIKLGNSIISKLRDLSFKESVRREKKVVVTDLIKEALKLAYPSVITE